MWKRLKRDETGQSIVIVALAMVGMLAFGALVLDGGNIYAQRRQMQNAADAASFAGARALALREDNSALTEIEILRQIHIYAERNAVPDTNGVPEDEYNANVEAYFLDEAGEQTGAQIGLNLGVPADAVAVAVTTRKTFGSFLAGIIGRSQLSAQANSSGMFGAVRSLTGLVPIVIREFDFEFGEEYAIWDNDKVEEDPESGIIVGGNRGWANFNGGNVSNSELMEWMRYGYPGRISEDNWINGSPGTRASTVQVAAERIGDVVLVPVYDDIRDGQNGNGQIDYHIISFAAFEITGVQTQGKNKKIFGIFQKYIAVDAEIGGMENDGVMTVVLRE